MAIDKTELDSLEIPRFAVPWPEAISPYAAEVEAQMLDWATEHGLIVSEKYRERAVRSKYGYLAARCYPKASRDLLQAIADYFAWFFLADDLLIDRVETVGPQTLQNLTALIDVLDDDLETVSLTTNSKTSSTYSFNAWLDVCRRLRALTGPVVYERFAAGMRMWAATAGLQMLNHLSDSASDSMRVYEAIRRHTSGMNPATALSDVANGGLLADDASFVRSDMNMLRRHANNIVAWSNDVQSLGVEVRQPGQFKNMVVVRSKEVIDKGRPLQESVDWTADRVRKEIAAFAQLSEKVLQEQDDEAATRNLVHGLRFWVRGYQDWAEKDRGRYAVLADADDRGFLEANGDSQQNGKH